MVKPSARLIRFPVITKPKAIKLTASSTHKSTKEAIEIAIGCMALETPKINKRLKYSSQPHCRQPFRSHLWMPQQLMSQVPAGLSQLQQSLNRLMFHSCPTLVQYFCMNYHKLSSNNNCCKAQYNIKKALPHRHLFASSFSVSLFFFAR